MSAEGPSPLQRELFTASQEVANRSRRGILEAGLRPAEPGDVFVLAATAEWPVEWALLERPRPDGPFLALPGDTFPLLGRRDLEVATTNGLLRLRCLAGVWLAPGALEPEKRVALLLPEDFARARAQAHEDSPSADDPAGFPSEDEDSPGYQRWLREVIEPASAAARGGAAPLSMLRPPVAERPEPRFAIWQVAAAALVLASLGLASWGVFEQRRGDRLAAGEKRTAATLAAERKSTEARFRQERAASLELRRQVAALEAPPVDQTRPLLNLPVAILLPEEEMRAATPDSALVVDGPLLVVVLKFAATDAAASYGVRLRRQGETAPVWSALGLRRSSQGAVQLALPRRLLPPGAYILDLDGRYDGRARTLAEYRLAVAPGGARR